jgi:hypothetical protein
MSDKIRQLLDQISLLENDLRIALREREDKAVQGFRFIKGRRIKFEESVRQTHRRIKTGVFQWLVSNRPQNFITGPVIYSMILPLLVLDLSVTLYQATCFPIYKITKVKRSDYIVFDRQQLAYLNFIEKLHCSYCAYANGLLAYVTEIVGRTEQYFCPIKHAKKVIASHRRYARFLAYGDAEDYARKLEEFRGELNGAPKHTSQNNEAIDTIDRARSGKPDA